MPLINTNQAVQELFGIDGKHLRTKANSYLRNGTIPKSEVKSEGFADSETDRRGKNYLTSTGVNCLFNALILDGFFNDTKKVKRIFEQSKERAGAYDLCCEILFFAQGVISVSALEKDSQEFLTELADDDFNLHSDRLSDPFKSNLPQMDLAVSNSGLLYQLLRTQRLSLSQKEALLLFLLEEDLEQANKLSKEIDVTLIEQDPALLALVKRVQKEYQEAQSFNSLLNLLPD